MPKKINPITDQELLSLCNEYFHYNEGYLFWKKIRRYSNRILGNEAGNVCPVNKYYNISTFRKTYKSHRIIFLMHHKYLPASIDHINGDKTDNRIENLRACTQQENCRNRGASAINKAGYKGVYPVRDKWRASIRDDQTQLHLGYFICKHEAAKAYNEAALKYHGEFAHLNIIP